VAHEGSTSEELATLGGGCFWCLEAVYEQLKGVSKVVSGYAAGKHPRPTYEEVCSGGTGHAEVVQITFDPAVISFRDLLDVFFTIHDPTTPNRQGHDVGTQYRSIILYHSPEQKAVAEQTIKQLGAEGVWKMPIVTEVQPLTTFFPGEAYHQQYYQRNTSQPYCQFVVAPKVAKARQRFLSRLKQEAI
jgi:peptide-methionine (S)-S-oxide reductase